MPNGIGSTMPAIERSPLLRNAENRLEDSESTPYEHRSFTPEHIKQPNQFSHGTTTSSPESGSFAFNYGFRDSADLDIDLFQALMDTIIELINIVKIENQTVSTQLLAKMFVKFTLLFFSSRTMRAHSTNCFSTKMCIIK